MYITKIYTKTTQNTNNKKIDFLNKIAMLNTAHCIQRKNKGIQIRDIHQDLPTLQNEMLHLGKCAKDNSKIFLFDTKVSKLSFGNIKFD